MTKNSTVLAAKPRTTPTAQINGSPRGELSRPTQPRMVPAHPFTAPAMPTETIITAPRMTSTSRSVSLPTMKFPCRYRGTRNASCRAVRRPESHPSPEYNRPRNPTIPAACLLDSMSWRLMVWPPPFALTIPGRTCSIAVVSESLAPG